MIIAASVYMIVEFNVNTVTEVVLKSGVILQLLLKVLLFSKKNKKNGDI